MLGSRFVSTLFGAVGCWVTVVLSNPSPPLDVSIRTRNLPGTSDEDTFLAIRRRFAEVALQGRAVANRTLSLGQSWEGVPLFTFGPIQINCTRCYILGSATAVLTVDASLDPAALASNITAQAADELANLTTTALEAIANYTDNIVNEALDFDLDLDDFDFDNFTLAVDTDFDIDIPPLPECRLEFRFDGLEIYVGLGMAIEGTLTVPIFQSQSPAGLSFGVPGSEDGLEVGVFLTVDLILSVDSGLDIQGGFHVKFEDGVGLDLVLFGRDVSEVNFNGGQFEFLPVTASVGDVVLRAVLRVGAHAGITVDVPELEIPGPNIDVGFGVEAGVFAYVAELVTHIIPGTAGNDDADCKLQVRQEYTLAIGAEAGATVHLMDRTWGPQPSTRVPIYYTTLVDECAVSGAPALAPTVTLAGRQDLETTTTVTEVKYTGVSCKSSGLVNCPASLRSTVVAKGEVTLTTAVPSGEDVVWALTANGVPNPVEFGTGAVGLVASSGAPTSYVPPKETSDADGNEDGDGDSVLDVLDGQGGLSQTGKIIIGVSVGVVVPVLAGLVAAIWFWRRKRGQVKGLGDPGVVTIVGSASPGRGPEMSDGKKPSAQVGIKAHPYQGT